MKALKKEGAITRERNGGRAGSAIATDFYLGLHSRLPSPAFPTGWRTTIEYNS